MSTTAPVEATLSEQASTPSAPEAAKTAGCCIFERGGHRFGIPISVIREIVAGSDITIVPGSPSFVAGVMNLRGQILPVVVVDRWLFMAERGYESGKPVLVLDDGRHVMGVQVDRVLRVAFIAASEVLPSNLTVRAGYWSGTWLREGNEINTLVDGTILMDWIQREMGGAAEAVSGAADGISENQATGET